MTTHDMTGRRLIVHPRYAAEVVAVAGLAGAAGWLRAGPGTGAVITVTVVGVLLLTLLAHEGGHAVAARLFGVRVHSLTLRGALSGNIRRDPAPSGPRRSATEMWICLAGPAVSLVLLSIAAAALWAGWTGTIGIVAWCLLAANGFAVLGSLPGLPGSDGSRAIRAARYRPSR